MKINLPCSVSERQNAHFRNAQRIATIGSWELNLINESLIWSDETYRIFGIERDEVVLSQEFFLSCVHPDDIEKLRDSQANALARRIPLDIEHRILRPSGEVRYIHERAEFLVNEDGCELLSGICHDITDRVLSERRIQQQENLLRLANSMVKIGAWEIDLSSGRVFWSDEVCDMHGVSHGTTPTLSEATYFYTPEYRLKLNEIFRDCVSSGRKFDEELEMVAAKGRSVWVRASGQGVRDATGMIYAIRGALQDITRRKLAELDALQLTERLKNTLESITDALFALDLNWRFTYLNKEAEHLLGRGREDLLGKCIWDEYPDAIGSNFYNLYHRVLEENTDMSFEEFFEDRNLWLEVRAFPSAEGVSVYLRNVTERRQAQDAARENQERFKIVSKATADAIWDWNLATDSIWWNESVFTLFGFAVQELEPDSNSWTKRIHAFDKERVLQGIHQVIDSDSEKWSDQYRFLRKDGTYAFVLDRGYVIRNDTGKAIRMVGSMTDLTEQKQSEIELARLNRALLLRGACDELINSVTDEKKLLSSVCQLALDKGGYRLAWIGYVQDDERCSISIESVAGEVDDIEYAKQLNLSWSNNDPSGLGLGPSGQTVRSGQPLAIDDVTLFPFFSPWLQSAQARGFRGRITLPLRYRNRIFGLIAFYSHGTLVASADEVKLLQEMADNVASGVQNIKAVQEKRLIQLAVSKAATSVTANAGKEFFEQLALNMAEAVGAHASFIARLLPEDPTTARTLAVIVDEQVTDNFDYALKNTPCENLQNLIECILPCNFSEHYPPSSSSVVKGAEAYAGRRLDDSNGRPIGVLFVLFRHPIKDCDLISKTLQIFASRASSELERQVSEVQLREQADLLDKAKDAIVVKGMNNRIRYWNKGAERLYGWAAEEAVGQQVEVLLLTDSSHYFQALDILMRQGTWSGETIEQRKDGSRIVVENQWTLVSDDLGVHQSIFAIKTDITQRKAAEREIHSLAFYDPLTGLPNRRFLIERLSAALHACGNTYCNGALLFVDLDNFKLVNDTLGHNHGDELLRQVAQRLSSCVRSSDLVSRIGGDEFVLMLESLNKNSLDAMAQASHVSEKILSAFISPFQIAGLEFSSTPSVGIALFDNQQSAQEVLKRADMAMYQAKAAGRNTVRIFDPEMESAFASKVVMESDLRSGILREEFVLYYQAQVNPAGEIIGAEVLTRWVHPEQGLVSPAKFIPLAEETGLILQLGEWVLRSTCRQLAIWESCPQKSKWSLSVNVSAKQLRHPAFVETVVGILKETGAAPEKLDLELTESMLVESVEETIEKMNSLKMHGIRFSLDDFGTGYSSLMYLKRLPLNQLKIDQSFIQDAITNPNDAAIARTIINLGQSLGLSVVAEGVETQEQWEFLLTHGCDAFQGYLFNRPEPAADFIKHFAANKHFTLPQPHDSEITIHKTGFFGPVLPQAV